MHGLGELNDLVDVYLEIIEVAEELFIPAGGHRFLDTPQPLVLVIV